MADSNGDSNLSLEKGHSKGRSVSLAAQGQTLDCGLPQARPGTYQEDGSRAEAPSNDAPPRPVPKPLGIMVYVTFDLVEPGRIVHPVYKGISAAGKGRW